MRTCDPNSTVFDVVRQRLFLLCADCGATADVLRKADMLKQVEEFRREHQPQLPFTTPAERPMTRDDL